MKRRARCSVMRQFRIRRAFLIFFIPLCTAPATLAVRPDPKLLSLVPPGAQIVAGMSAPSLGGQPDSFLLLTHNNVVDLEDFFALSGADSSKIIHQVIFVAGDGRSDSLRKHSLLVSGQFDQKRIYRSAPGVGTSITSYRGITCLAVQPLARDRGAANDVRWLAVIESNVLLLGTIPSVQQEIDRHLARNVEDPSLMRKLTRLRREDEAWCVLAGSPRDGGIRDALDLLSPKLANLILDGDTLQFGIHYGGRVEFEYEINTDSNSRAEAISNTLAQSLAGTSLKTSSHLRDPNMTMDLDSVHGIVRVSKPRYDAWLAEVKAHTRARIDATRRDTDSMPKR
jgi:hypothetical protein